MKVELIQLNVSEPCYRIDGILYNKYELLALASKLAHKSKKDALIILKMTEELYLKFNDETFDELCDCVRMFILYEDLSKDELYYQEVFKENCKNILGEEYEIYNKKNLQRKRPDAWVIKDHKEIPVEMKVHEFNKTAFKQLLNYMKMYKCDNGIAIGKPCDIKLPDNILFIDIKDVKKFDN